MGILQSILDAIQSGTTTPPVTQAATQAILSRIGTPDAAPTAAGGPVDAPQTAPAPAAQPAPAHMGIMSAMGHILAPEPGSFWQSALTNGLPNARAGQVAYLSTLQKSADDRAKEQEATRLAVAQRKQAEAKLPTASFITTPTGSVLKPDAAGNLTTAYEPPVKSSETERLIDLWHSLTPGPYRDLIERAIKGVQYSPDYIAADTRRKVTAAKARPRAAGAAASSGLPAGFKLVN